MENLDTINAPTSWVNSMVKTVQLNGTLCICIDPSDLNNAIRCEYYPTQTIEDVVTRMLKVTFFFRS